LATFCNNPPPPGPSVEAAVAAADAAAPRMLRGLCEMSSSAVANATALSRRTIGPLPAFDPFNPFGSVRSRCHLNVFGIE